MNLRARSGISKRWVRKSGIEVWLSFAALREKMTAGALLHYGQGKWYPGEPLPRWALGCYWRRDGVAVWENIDFIAREDQNHGFGSSDALRFAEALARRLQVSSGNTLPAFNPENITSEPAGYILPLRRRQKDSGELFWSTQLWFPCPGTPAAAVSRRFAHRLPHTYRVDALGSTR